MSFKLILLIAAVLPLTVYGADPDWTGITCTLTEFTIKATSPNNIRGQLEVSDATSDKNPDGSAVTGCTVSHTGPCDGSGTGDPCVSTLVVDLTTAAQNTIDGGGLETENGDFTADDGVCPPNGKTDSDDPQDYTKLVVWRQSDVNTNLDTTDTDQNSNSIKTYRVTCRHPKVHQGEETTAEILIEAFTIIPGELTTVDEPVPSIAMSKYDPSLGEEVTLTVSFIDSTPPTNFWTNLLVTDCSASNDNFGSSDVAILTNSCPVYDLGLDDKNIFTGYTYTDTSMALTFKAFRLGVIKQLHIKCSFLICPATTHTTSCPLPTDIDTTLMTCTGITPQRRYKQVMGHRTSTSPESFTSTLSTVIVIESDTVIVDSEGQVAAGYTCLTTGTFTAVIAILSVLCLISVAVTVTVCLQGRGRSGGKSSAMDLPPVGYNNYSVSKHSLNA